MLRGGKDPALNIKRIKEIKEAIGIPMVLHGASGNSPVDEDDMISWFDQVYGSGKWELAINYPPGSAVETESIGEFYFDTSGNPVPLEYQAYTAIKNFKAKSINNLNKNDLLIKQLIDSDFIYSRRSVDKRVPDIVESTLTIKENNLVCTLDIFKLNKSIKQFIKILEKLDTLKSEQKIQLYVLCKDKYYLHLVNRMSKRYFLRDIIRPCTILPDLSGKLNKDITKYLFILGEYEFSRNFLYKLVYYRISLISKFNLKYERRTFGFYKIQNNLDDYKKLMFLFILIEKVV
jgi:hypothetical protein